MAKDVRLYARFDIAMDEHPKVMLLSDAAFRALIESTMYARRQLTDGFLAAGIVARKWGNEIAAELTTNHPDRPSWTAVEGGYLIRDYAEHQTTNADIRAKREAGSMGGKARAERIASKASSKPVAPATDMPEQTASRTGSTSQAKTETETDKEKKTLFSIEQSDGVSSDPKSPYTSAFLAWWDAYPRKESKGDAWKAWEQLRKARMLPAPDDLIAATKAYKAKVTDPQFLKLPAGWLRAHKWEDEAAATSTGSIRDQYAGRDFA